ncbi:MAG: hypothetical protein KAH24_09115 [Holophagae bacterium]|nr:hypothetical protein [Holophagae bacterium]
MIVFKDIETHFRCQAVFCSPTPPPGTLVRIPGTGLQQKRARKQIFKQMEKPRWPFFQSIQISFQQFSNWMDKTFNTILFATKGATEAATKK